MSTTIPWPVELRSRDPLHVISTGISRDNYSLVDVEFNINNCMAAPTVTVPVSLVVVHCTLQPAALSCINLSVYLEEQDAVMILI